MPIGQVLETPKDPPPLRVSGYAKDHKDVVEKKQSSQFLEDPVDLSPILVRNLG